MSELPGTPHIHSSDLEEICRSASGLGYEGIEFFLKSAKGFPVSKVIAITKANNLNVCAFGTGAGKVLYGLTLSDPEKEVRKKAIGYIGEIMKLAAEFGALVIIGSMQGSVDQEVGREKTIERLSEGLSELAHIAGQYNVNLVFEPINRYESNLVNSLRQGIDLIKSTGSNNIKLLADLFHMNIEESSVWQAIIQTGSYIGHVHFADSNRLFPGLGHTDFNAAFNALKHIRYGGYVSTEAVVTHVQTDMKHAMAVYNAFAS